MILHVVNRLKWLFVVIIYLFIMYLDPYLERSIEKSLSVCFKVAGAQKQEELEKFS